MAVLNDIWRKVNEEIGFFTKETFEKVPRLSGIYGWFYPLRLTTSDPNEFINEINIILNYDCNSFGKPTFDNEIEFGWQKIKQSIEIDSGNVNFDKYKDIWEEYFETEEKTNYLQTILMKASILMPPLYVGKSSNLYNRCKQHILGGSGENNFHNRFENFAGKSKLKAKKVEDLLFVCIKTSNDTFDNPKLEDVIETIMKYLSKPKYSKL